MMVWAIIVVVVIGLLITLDAVKGLRTKQMPMVQSEAMKVQNEKIVKIEAEVEAKMNEIHRHQSERLVRQGTVLAPPAPQAARDPMNDTRCMQAVKEKADEIERLGREKGISKS